MCIHCCNDFFALNARRQHGASTRDFEKSVHENAVPFKKRMYHLWRLYRLFFVVVTVYLSDDQGYIQTNKQQSQINNINSRQKVSVNNCKPQTHATATPTTTTGRCIAFNHGCIYVWLFKTTTNNTTIIKTNG